MTGDKAEFQKLADDVYAFVGKLNDANAMAIVTTQGVVVVDTGNNPPETRGFRNVPEADMGKPFESPPTRTANAPLEGLSAQLR